jgi:hypothetical protein
MIRCPYCGRDIEVQTRLTSVVPGQAEAKTKWYFATYWFVIALMCVGPFALPLLWFNPRYKLITKIIVSAAIIAISIWFYIQLKAAWEMAQKQLGGLHSGY